MSGEGQLRDNTECSTELREYLSRADSESLAKYVEGCLAAPFPKSGHVLQDIVNELGRRLDYDVTNGRYSGVQGQVGYDGIWTANGHSLIVEVKTTDTYRISLETTANYRSRLTETGEVGERSSILFVVGREDTGDLEAQIRGSRHAWDVRLVSADSLIKLVRLKQETDDPETATKIRTILTPIEYTKLDVLVEVMFAAATDVANADDTRQLEGPANDSDDAPARSPEFTDPGQLDAKRAAILSALSEKLEVPLVKKSRALSWDPTHQVRAVCTVSKRYVRPGQIPYWYAFHPKWRDYLREASQGFLVLGCMDRSEAYAIPFSVLTRHLDSLHMTELEDRFYWHVKLQEDGQNLFMQLPKSGSTLPLSEFRLPIGQGALIPA